MMTMPKCFVEKGATHSATCKCRNVLSTKETNLICHNIRDSVNVPTAIYRWVRVSIKFSRQTVSFLVPSYGDCDKL